VARPAEQPIARRGAVDGFPGRGAGPVVCARAAAERLRRGVLGAQVLRLVAEAVAVRIGLDVGVEQVLDVAVDDLGRPRQVEAAAAMLAKRTAADSGIQAAERRALIWL
jgi:hypothetical protein